MDAEVKPRIALLLPSLGGGGAERVHIYLSRRFLQLGYEVDFVLLNAEGVLLSEVPERARVIGFRTRRVRYGLVPLVRYLRRTRPAILLAAMWPLTAMAVVANRLAREPARLVVSEHNTLSAQTVTESSLVRMSLRPSIRLLYPLASARIAVSKGVADDLSALGNLDRSSVNVIYNPAAVPVSPAADEFRDPWSGSFGRRILCVGTLKAQKDHATLIRAFAQVRKRTDATLVILGDGTLRSDLERLVAELELSSYVRLPGFELDPMPWYRGADLFVLSSRYEGFGNVIVEALQHGLRVVSTDCPSGPREILDDGKYGRLVPVGDVRALSDAMLEALWDDTDRAPLRGRAAAFSVERAADRYLRLMFPDDPRFAKTAVA